MTHLTRESATATGKKIVKIIEVTATGVLTYWEVRD